nr:ABC transporter ATP-binding protein [Nocardioides thalensis]
MSLPDGEVLAVVGPSGCGKSSLLRAVAGLEPLSSGRVSWAGQDLAGVPTHRRGFALMFQDGQLFDHLTVARNVAYALRLRRVSRAETATRVEELLELVGLGGYGARLPRTLSGGERQRVALARSLAAEPRLLLLDEPLSALDAGLRTRLAADLRRILREAGTTALLVTHDQEEAFTIADRLAVMRAGRVVQQGTTAEVWAAPADPETALFLGYAAVLEGPAADRLMSNPPSWSAESSSVVRAPTTTSDSTDHEGGLGEPSGTTRRVAVRRSAVTALPARDHGAGGLTGRVVSVQPTPDELRLVVDVAGIGELPAVGTAGWFPEAGETVSLRVDRVRLAILPETRGK